MPASSKGGPSSKYSEELIPLRAAAKLSGLSHDHLRRLAGEGELKATKMGRDWFTTEKAVREYLARNRRPGPGRKKKRYTR